MSKPKQERGFTGYWIPVEITEVETITWTQILIWAEIHALSHGSLGKCILGNDGFAERFRISEGTVRNALSTLRQAGLVEWRFEGEVRVLSAYWPKVEESEAFTKSGMIEKPEAFTKSCKPMHEIVQPVYIERTVEGTGTPIVPTPPPDLLSLTGVTVDESEPEKIYKLYPRKVGKPTALRAIRTALKSIPYELMVQHVRRFAESVAGKDLQFVPHPATWFNQRRWEDPIHNPEVPTKMSTTGMTYEEAQKF